MGRCYEHLTAEERGTIFAMTLRGESGRKIAAALGRAQSTIARELRRNGHRAATGRPLMGRPPLAGGYNPARAGARARRLRRKARRVRILPD